jgi:RHS repeat-associated protein
VYDGLNSQTVAENDLSICTNSFNSLSWPLAETIEFTIDEAPLKTPFVISREFDDVGALVKLTYPNGRELELERDGLDRLVRIQNLSNGNDYRGSPNFPAVRPIAQMKYAGQQRDQCLFDNGANTAYRHDGAGRVIEIAHSDPNAPLLAIQYLYDAASNVRIRNDVLPTGPSTERFAYDSLYRLAHEFKPDTTEIFDFSSFGISSVELANPLPDRQSAITTLIGSLELPQIPTTYDYDLVGNRDLERTANGISIDYDPSQLDQYISRNGTNYSHDTNGNLKLEKTVGQQRFSTYDSLNRLVQVSTDEAGIDKIAAFWHDALGRRILEISGGNITQLICDGDDVIAEYRDGGLFAQYVFDDGIDRPLHIAAEGVDHRYHADLVGSVRLLTDDNGDSPASYRYAPFGELIDAIGDNIFNPWRYTGRRFEFELETYNYRARQYDPQIGRFVQRDPEGMVDGTNLFTYTMNDPMGYNDPLGMSRGERNSEHTFPDPLATSEDLNVSYPALDNVSYPALDNVSYPAFYDTFGCATSISSCANDPKTSHQNEFEWDEHQRAERAEIDSARMAAQRAAHARYQMDLEASRASLVADRAEWARHNPNRTMINGVAPRNARHAAELEKWQLYNAWEAEHERKRNAGLEEKARDRRVYREREIRLGRGHELAKWDYRERQRAWKKFNDRPISERDRRIGIAMASGLTLLWPATWPVRVIGGVIWAGGIANEWFDDDLEIGPLKITRGQRKKVLMLFSAGNFGLGRTVFKPK